MCCLGARYVVTVAPRKPTTPAAKRTSVIEVAPDVFGDQGRLDLVATAISGIQQQQENLKLLLAMNPHHTDKSPHPDRDGSVTYAQVRRQLNKALEGIRKQFPEEWNALKAQQATEDAPDA